MCLIILKEEGKTFKKDKFLTAVENNPHGYGVSVALGNGRLLTKKAIDYDKEMLYNDIVTDEIGKYGEYPVLCHLRYTTAGKTILRNSHPFPILEFDKDGVDLRMAHNGTIFGFKPKQTDKDSWSSDTRKFVKEIVRPLIKSMWAGNKIDRTDFESEEDKILWLASEMKTLLESPVLTKVLEEFIPASSVLVFIDGFGNTLYINKMGNGGIVEDGVYYSNKYSFNKGHRAEKKNQHGNYSNVYYPKNSQGSYGSPKTTTVKPAEVKSNVKKLEDPVSYERKFSKDYNIENFGDVLYFGDELLETIKDEAPDDLLELTKELMLELYLAISENTKLKGVLKDLQNKNQEKKVG